MVEFGRRHDGPVPKTSSLRRSLEASVPSRVVLVANFGLVVKGRLTFTPEADGYYSSCGIGTVQPVLAGVVRSLASPTGTVEGCNVRFTGTAA